MSNTPIPWKHVRNILVLFAPLWVGCAVLFGALSMGYSLFRRDVYSARLPLVVRDEATSSVDRLGRFASQEELKAAQQTILEMAQNPEVVGAALREIGAPGWLSTSGWPSTDTIDKIASSSVNLVAPKGAEFGNTEVVYLQVEAGSQDRAEKFCKAIFESLTEQLREVRRVRADSVIDELTHARDLAQQTLEETTSKMRKIEVEIGSELGDLRNLNDTIAGDGTNRRTLEQYTRELEIAELDLRRREALHDLLVAGSRDPRKLLISGSDLLTSEPSLQRLKAGLIDSQLIASELAGRFTTNHPRRVAAMRTELEIQARMQEESKAAAEALQQRLSLDREHVAQLKARAVDLNKTLGSLADIRVTYSKLDAEVKQRTEQLTQADQSLAEAAASRSAALSTNLITALGPPQVSDRPVGPGKTTLTLGGSLAGLLFGLGAVFLVAPSPSSTGTGRRWSDYLGHGRRQSDRVGIDPNAMVFENTDRVLANGSSPRRGERRSTQPEDVEDFSDSVFPNQQQKQN